MLDSLAGLFIFVLGLVFLWLGIFQFEWIYKGLKEIDKGKIDLLPFISNYWFYRITFIGVGLLMVFLTTNSFINYIFG